jgi:hypothetical protein
MISGSENGGGLWEAYLKSLEEMDEASGKQDLVEEGHQETVCLQNQENNGEKSYLIEGDRVMIDTKEEISSHMDKEEEGIIVGSSGEESSHL